MIASIFTGQFSFDMLNGPVGIYHNVDSVVKQGIIALTYYTALLSVNLGIMNLLPIPDLMVVEFYLLSMKQFSEDQLIKSRNNYNRLAGAIFVLIIMVLVTWNDIQRYFL